ncbi:hypothetical protein Q8F55_009230 [Vanrija albida]|uniref:Uncharacterized protein n=1 Tax=Vanrija albida TaxID=181172 RepID=A0ABR3PT25_9TREE
MSIPVDYEEVQKDPNAYQAVPQGFECVYYRKTDIAARVKRILPDWDVEGVKPEENPFLLTVHRSLSSSPTDAYEIVREYGSGRVMATAPLGLLEYARQGVQEALCFIPLWRLEIDRFGGPEWKVKDQVTGEYRAPTEVEREDTLYTWDAPQREQRLERASLAAKELADARAANQAIIDRIRAKPGYVDFASQPGGVYVGEVGTSGGGAVSKAKYESVANGSGYSV